ncbi:MAG: exodeoxyribonuclease III [Patescibacteria group bacterium]
MSLKNLKIYSWNVNGVRAILAKDFMKWIDRVDPDIVCLQEIKADASVFPQELHNKEGYKIYVNHAQKKGYAGTAVLTKIKPKRVIQEIGENKFDDEGRIQLLEFDDFYLVNTYFPNSQPELVRLNFKVEFNKKYLKFIQQFKDKPVILTGDFNFAHREIDIAHPKQNEKNPGFTPEERAYGEDLIKAGFVDVWRELHPEEIKYSWWSYRFGARSRNVGWRIDYFWVSRELIKKITKAEIHNEVLGSDHCPVSLEF